MQLIPVIDIRAGQAVRAVAGRRDRYRPLATPLCDSADPADVIDAYRTLFPFRTFYLADLDAIEGRGDNAAVVETLRRRFADAWWWLDAGFAAPEQLARWTADDRLRAVLGSESQLGVDEFDRLREAAERRRLRPLLSLDYRDGRFLGPPALAAAPDRWPRDLILMQLDRVGVGAGPGGALPDVADRRFFAAGGVRDGADLRRLAAAGYAGALVASALHDGRLTAADCRDAP